MNTSELDRRRADTRIPVWFIPPSRKPSGTRECACGRIISANKTACKACNDKTEAS